MFPMHLLKANTHTRPEEKLVCVETVEMTECNKTPVRKQMSAKGNAIAQNSDLAKDVYLFFFFTFIFNFEVSWEDSQGVMFDSSRKCVGWERGVLNTANKSLHFLCEPLPHGALSPALPWTASRDFCQGTPKPRRNFITASAPEAPWFLLLYSHLWEHVMATIQKIKSVS